MIYYDSTTNKGISQKIDFLCDSTDTSYPVIDKQREMNNAIEDTIGVILEADGTWEYDDTNRSDLPIGTTDLVADQQDYAFDDDFLEITTVRVKDNNGIWRKLTPFDKREVGIAMDEFYKTSGMPQFYDKQGRSIFLYPAPATANVTTTAGLKVDYQRTHTEITDLASGDATKSPGFASPYHSVVAFKASLPYCMKFKPERVVAYQNEIFRFNANLKKFYGKREGDVKNRIVAVSSNAE